MAEIKILSDVDEVAGEAAALTATALTQAVEEYDTATWALAGGGAPLATYKLLALDYKNTIDWPHVKFLIGDERCVALDDPESNWRQAQQALLSQIASPAFNQLRPLSDQGAEAAARQYEQTLKNLPSDERGRPRLDLVWLGMGEDGHTLSLFPGDPVINDQRLVVPVHNSPKPPPDRISLGLGALQGSRTVYILTAGPAKADAVKRALDGDTRLPIVRAIQTVESAGGRVTWLVDNEAAKLLPRQA